MKIGFNVGSGLRVLVIYFQQRLAIVYGVVCVCNTIVLILAYYEVGGMSSNVVCVLRLVSFGDSRDG